MRVRLLVKILMRQTQKNGKKEFLTLIYFFKETQGKNALSKFLNKKCLSKYLKSF
jgi:hypothetical protein